MLHALPCLPACLPACLPTLHALPQRIPPRVAGGKPSLHLYLPHCICLFLLCPPRTAAGECAVASGGVELESLFLLAGHAALDTSQLPLGERRAFRVRCALSALCKPAYGALLQMHSLPAAPFVGAHPAPPSLESSLCV